MADPLLRTILGLLAGSPTGLTVNAICNQLAGANATSLHEEIALRTGVINALTVLKAEHRAWPTGEYWKITSRGRDT